MHNNLVTVNGTKMGKSLGNFITLEDLFKQFDPMVVRYFILQFHYRKPVDFSIDAIKACEEQYNKIAEALSKIEEIAGGEIVDVKDAELLSVKQNFENAMDDDFNTPLGIAEFIRFGKIAAKIVSSGNINIAKEANNLVKMFKDVLGFEFVCDKINTEDAEPDNFEKLLGLVSAVRDKLRADKNYAMSDFIRDELTKLDISISDKKIK
jgi:cysteinyl-tRNA synthetase